MGNLCTVDVFDVYDRQRPVELNVEVEDADTHTKQGPRYGDLFCLYCMHGAALVFHLSPLYNSFFA